MNFEEYIQPELMVLIPVLYLMGEAIKRSESVENKKIPIALGIAGALLAVLYVFSVSGVTASGLFSGIVQGVLCAGCAVYANQVYKHAKE